jgi:hypothetical protein
MTCSTVSYIYNAINKDSARTISKGFEDGPESTPSGIVSIAFGSLMIQLAQMPAQGGSRDAKKLRRASLILARLFIDKTHVTFDCAR